jgi:hypothetical protein
VSRPAPEPATQVFLHSPSEAPDARTVALQVPEFEWYGERALLLARPSDIVAVAHPVDERYLGYLHSLGIGPRFENVIVVGGVTPGAGLSEVLSVQPAAIERLAGRLRGVESVVLSPFFATPAIVALAGALEELLGRPVRVEGGPPELVRQLHDKPFLRGLAQSLRIPVAPGDVVVLPHSAERTSQDLDGLRRAIERRLDVTGRVIVRGASGASGSSTFLAGPDEIEAAVESIAARTDNRVYLVEPLFPATSSPNVEVVVEIGDAPPRVGVTDQVLNVDLVYRGSVWPSSASRAKEMVEDALAIAAWMRRRGFTGRAGFDFVEHERADGSSGYFLTEINPRVNGASYPLALLARLADRASGGGAPAPAAFRSSNVAVAAQDFDGLEALCGSLFYDPRRGEGVIPYAVGALAAGKVGVACFGVSAARVDALFAELVYAVAEPPARSAAS